MDKLTKNDLNEDFTYEVAMKISKSLLEKGLITNEEYQKLVKLNNKAFNPINKCLLPWYVWLLEWYIVLTRKERPYANY